MSAKTTTLPILSKDFSNEKAIFEVLDEAIANRFSVIEREIIYEKNNNIQFYEIRIDDSFSVDRQQIY